MKRDFQSYVFAVGSQEPESQVSNNFEQFVLENNMPPT